MCCVFNVRALGDKSELPSLVAAPLPSATDSASDVDTDTQDCGIESELSDLAVSAVAYNDTSGEANAGSHDVVSSSAECEDVSSSRNHSVAETEAAVQQHTEDGAAASGSNCEAGADNDMATNNVDVSSDSKGEMNCLII